MDSPSASSATLSNRSWEDDEPMDLDSDVGSPREEGFVQPDEYTHPGSEYSLSPSMKAASNPDPRVLEAVLANGNKIYKERCQHDLQNRRKDNIPMFSGSKVDDFHFVLANVSDEFGPNGHRVSSDPSIGVTSPLMEAIRARIPGNVQQLLDAGADPNGFPRHVLEAYAKFFLRFRPKIPRMADECGDVASRKVLLQCIDFPQVTSLTWEEVEDRFLDGIAPFWCEEDFIPANFYSHGDSMPSLVEAAKSGSILIFDQLLDAGADASFWMTPHFYIPEPPTVSSLSISSPLHAAVEEGDDSMVCHLLDLGLNPNTLPLANPTRCLTPLMTAIINWDPRTTRCFERLAEHPSINFEIRTPVYNVHILHFVVADMDVGLLKTISSITPLKNAGRTALGHSLLHVACMPERAHHVQGYAPEIFESIHETSYLGRKNDQTTTGMAPGLKPNDRMCRDDFDAQSDIVKFLCVEGINDFAEKDVHGNTPLHYLVSWKTVNEGLLGWLLQMDSVARAYADCKNGYGYTPRDLMAAGKMVRDEKLSGWMNWFNKDRKRERERRKERIWKDLLCDHFSKSGEPFRGRG